MRTLRLGALALLTPMIATAQVIAITGGTVYTGDGRKLDGATVLIRDSLIIGVGADVAIPAGARRIDAAGKWVTPGLIALGTTLGVQEIGAVRDTRDGAARGENNVAASFRVWEAFNPRATTIPVARQDGGITTVGVMPGGNFIAGMGAIAHLDPAGARIMLAPAAMVATLDNAQAAGAGSRAEAMDRMRSILRDARFYATAKARYDAGALRQLAARASDLEALQPVLRGTIPMIVQADRSTEILQAITLGREFGIRVIVSSAAEAWMVARELAAARVPVLTGAMNNIPQSFSALGQRQENLAILRAAGVDVAIVGDGAGDEGNFNVRSLRYEAGSAVAYGLPWMEALRAITETPAKLVGLSAKVGTLATGKLADVVVWSGDPFEYSTQPLHVFTRGSDVRVKTRQEELSERYRAAQTRR
jgi:imidazolonepropionase-like amidohydrolase